MNTQDELHEIRHRLDQLAPPSTEAPGPVEAAHAWRRFQNETLPHSRPSPTFSIFDVKTWRHSLMKTKSIRLATAGVIALMVAALFMMPATRAAANQFLGLFRVQKFAPISVSPETLSRLENLELDGVYPGDFVWTREPQEPQTVASYDEAAVVADYRSWLITLDALGPPDEIAATAGGAAILTVDLASSRTILEAGGVDPTLLPDQLEGADIAVDVPGTVFSRWTENDITLIQGHTPQVDYPDGFDPAPIGQAVLQLLGMNEIEAYRLSQNIDWTNTLILPVPQNIGTFREVPVFSTTGLLVESLDGAHAVVLWQNNDSVYMVSGDLSGAELLELLPQ